MSATRDALLLESALGGYGLVRLPLAEAAAAIAVSPPEQGWDRRVVATGQPMSAALDYLEIVTHPATRYVLFPLAHDWTVVVSNARSGSDVADLLGHLKKRQPALAVRVVDRGASIVEQNGFRVRC
jgi:hypothetical protein